MRKILLLTIVFVFAGGITLAAIMASAQEDYNIPAWIKNNAAWWSEGQIDDASFVSGIKYMIENGIMEINTGDLSIADEYEDRGDFYITYKPNPNSRYTGDDTAIAWLKNVELLEAEVEFLNENFRLPYDVEVVAQECDEINAWYDWEKKQLVMCYEFIDDVFEGYYYFYGEDEDFDEQVWADYGYNVVDYVFWHEVGHAFIDIYELPITGLEEDVADQFAALMLSYTYDSETGSYTLGQTMLYDVGTWYYNENYYWSEIYPAETGEEYVNVIQSIMYAGISSPGFAKTHDQYFFIWSKGSYLSISYPPASLGITLIGISEAHNFMRSAILNGLGIRSCILSIASLLLLYGALHLSPLSIILSNGMYSIS